MKAKIKLGKEAKVNIKWKVTPLDYSHEAEENIKAKFSKKYGIDKSNVKVEPLFIVKTKDNEVSPYASEMISRIQEPEFQQDLFKKYISDKEIENCEFYRIQDIDNLINNNINYEVYEKNKKYMVNWIKWSNFMSYGENNYVDFRKLDGLVLLSSEPANQGGKTTFSVDLFRFLLFGKVTSREGDWTLEKAFNHFKPECTEVSVEGSISIDGTEYIIKRVLTRPALNKRTARSRITQTISYFKKVNDSEMISLADVENKGESTNTETNKIIKDAIGNERDFDMMICVTDDNLKDLITLKDADRGRLVSRWIGLLPLEEKEKIARETFNKSIVPGLLMEKYNKEELKETVSKANEAIEKAKEEISVRKDKIKESSEKLNNLNIEKDTLLQSKKEIDETLIHADVATIENTNERIKNEGIKIKNIKENNLKTLNEIGEVKFDEKEFDELSKKRDHYLIEVNNGRNNCKNIKRDIDLLKKGEFCPTCGAKLKNVDNTEKIKNKEEDYNSAVEKGKNDKKILDETESKLASLKDSRDKYNEKVKLQLIIDKNDVDMENLRGRLRENLRLLKDIEKNKSAIENNNKIDTALNIVKASIETETRLKERLQSEINSYENSISNNTNTIKECERFIKTIDEEEIQVRHWKLYLEMIGRNGISKMVLRQVLPIINGELSYLLNDVCDFDIEVGIDNHNDVTFYLIKDGVRSNLASGSGFERTVSSLALRSVLGKISNFSKPSFIVLDEILGGVADENYDNLKLLYEKIAEDYYSIYHITHNKAIVEWHNKFITIKKTDNISRIETSL